MFLAVSLAMLGCLLPSHAQDEVPVFPQSRLQLSENNWIEFRPKLTERDRHYGRSATCSNPCRGGKHHLHEECDTSCDGPCTEIHKYRYICEWTCRPGGDLRAGGQKFGSPDTTWTIAGQVSAVVKKAFKDTERNYDLPHWNKTPCSMSIRWQRFITYQVQADYQFFRNDIAPDGRKILVKGPSGTWDYGTVAVPLKELEEPTTLILCRCSILDDVKDDNETGLYIEEGGKRELATTGQVDEKNISIECPSMNECVVSCTNPGATECTVNICPGTTLECVDGSCQDMMVCESASLTCPPFSTAQVSIAATPEIAGASMKARAACLNMHKAEPRTGVKYRLAMPSKGSTVAIAQRTDRENFRGSWDQIRMWIVTDHASRDEIARILFPRPKAGLYLNCLHQVNEITGLDLTAAEFSRCVDPALIIGATADREATDWYVDFWGKKDPKGLANWLNQHWADLAGECFGATPGPSHAADLFNALCSSGNDMLVEAGLNGLEKAVPADKRALLAGEHGLEGALGLLLSTNAKLAERALAVAELYRDAGSSYMLLNLNDALGEELKSRSAKLFKEIAGAGLHVR